MFVQVDITIGAYGSIFNHFQKSNPEISSQKQVIKVAFKKNQKKSDLPTLFFFYVTPIKPLFLGLSNTTKYRRKIMHRTPNLTAKYTFCGIGGYHHPVTPVCLNGTKIINKLLLVCWCTVRSVCTKELNPV